MDFLLRRRIAAADLVGIAIGTALAGHGAANLLSAAWRSHAAPAPHRARAPSPVPAAATGKSVDAIVGRNLFCSARGDAPSVEPGRRALRLLAIMFAPPPSDPRWSLAVVRDDETATVGPYAVGARVGGATVEAIEDVRVVLDLGGGRREILELLQLNPAAPPGARAPGDGIRKTGTHSYELRRAVLEAFLAGGLSRLPRVVPLARDGAPVGLRLLDVAADGPFGSLGLASGDVLLEVNGRSIATPDTALTAYTMLRTAGRVWLVVERAGQRVRMDYVIR